jgi:apolipoprotein N-acyltransferase
MTSAIASSADKARFYFSIQVAQIAWVGIALAVGGALAVPSLPLYVATMGGMLGILAVAMRNPTYARLRIEKDELSR